MQSKKEKQEKVIEEENNLEDIEDSEEDHHVFNEKLQCRFYRKDFPEEGDLVIVSSRRMIWKNTIILIMRMI